MARRQEHQTQASGWKPMAKRMALSVALSVALLAGLLAAAAAVCLQLDLAQALLPVAAIPLAGLAAFIAAFVHVSGARRQGLIMGVLTASALYVCVLAGALLASRASVGVNAVVLLLVTLAAGAVGGIAAANRPGKR